MQYRQEMMPTKCSPSVCKLGMKQPLFPLLLSLQPSLPCWPCYRNIRKLTSAVIKFCSNLNLIQINSQQHDTYKNILLSKHVLFIYNDDLNLALNFLRNFNFIYMMPEGVNVTVLLAHEGHDHDLDVRTLASHFSSCLLHSVVPRSPVKRDKQ